MAPLSAAQPSMVRLALLALAGGALLAVGVSDAEWSTTINKAGRQRMLSQKMSKEFLLVALGLDTAADQAAMQATVTEFDDMLAKLINGSSGESIAAPPNTQISDQLGVVQDLWTEFQSLLTSNVGASPMPADVLANVSAQSVPLLVEMNRAVGMYTSAAQAANAAVPGKVVDIAGRQRMLSQRMSKEALLVALGVEVESSKAALTSTMALFESSFEGLVLGSADLSLPKTTDVCILQQMGVVGGLWATFEPLLSEVLSASTPATETLSKIREENPKLLVEANAAVTLYVASGSGTPSCTLNTVTDAEFATAINKAGRQRMLSQKMSKELFLLALGKATKPALEATIEEFDTVLGQLMIGSAAAGLPAPPNQDIADALGEVLDLWQPFHAELEAAAGAASVSADRIASIAAENLPLLSNMNEAVGLYATAAEAAGANAPGTVVNKAGRQRMLTQKMSKEAMLVKLDHDAESNKLNLQRTIMEFDEVLSGLVDGSEQHDLPATDDACILAQLAVVRGLWEPFKAVLGKFVAGEADDAAVTAVDDMNLPLLVEMNKAVGLYVEAASGQPLTCKKGTPSQAAGHSGLLVALAAAGVLAHCARAQAL